MPLASTWTISSDKLPAARPERIGDTPARTPKSTTTTVTTTAATMTVPSFALIDGRPSSGRLERRPAEAQRAGRRVARRLGVGGPVGPAQDGVDPGDELPGAERLGQVVVGADGQADEQVGLGVAGRQHEDGHRPVLLDP